MCVCDMVCLFLRFVMVFVIFNVWWNICIDKLSCLVVVCRNCKLVLFRKYILVSLFVCSVLFGLFCCSFCLWCVVMICFCVVCNELLGLLVCFGRL